MKFKIIGYYFKSSLDDSIKRNNKRRGKEKIPEKGIKATYNKLEIPEIEEGFDELYYVKLEHNSFKINVWDT